MALTLKVFRAFWIHLYDPDIFSDVDFIQAVAQNVKGACSKDRIDIEEQCQIVSLFTDFAQEEKMVTIPQPSISRASSTSRLLVFDEIGLLQAAPPKKASNRGRKPMQTTVLIFPGGIAALKDKTAKQVAVSSPKKSQPL